MSEYYAEHESIAEIGERVSGEATELDSSSSQLSASATKIARSQTLDSLGYASLTSRTQQSVTKLSGKVKEISNILNTVSALYADYEGRVIAALDASVNAGNNYSRESRHEVRDVNDQYGDVTDGSISNKPSPTWSTDTPGSTTNSGPTPEEKRQWTLNWLEQNHPELLEQIYDRLNNPGAIAAGAVTAGTVASVVSGTGTGTGTMSAESSSTTGTQSSKPSIEWSTDSKSADTGGTGTQNTGAGTDNAGGGFSIDPTSGISDSGVTDAGAGSGSGGGGGMDPGVGGSSGDSDWVADMLKDAVDADLAKQSEKAISGAASTRNPDATKEGPNVFKDSLVLPIDPDPASPFAQFITNMGKSVLDAVTQYGVQAGILAGGAGAAYASSGVAVEAVAHCAEFLATTCMPGVHGFMKKARSAVRVTTISIGTALSGAAPGVGGIVA